MPSSSEELGVPRAAVDVLIGKATDLDLPLAWAVTSNRVEYVRLLLDAGADPGTRTGGTIPLENAIYHGNTQVVDLLAEHGIVPQALWTYAACGRLDLVQACFDADGRLRPDAAASRPNPADFFPFPPRIPATDDPEEIIAEAFVHACQHGRTEVARWFLDRGVSPDVAPYLGRTGLHWAIMHRQLEVIRLLLERGADPSIRDEMLSRRRRRLAAHLLRHSLARSRDPATPRSHRVPDGLSYRWGGLLPTKHTARVSSPVGVRRSGVGETTGRSTNMSLNFSFLLLFFFFT